MGDIRFTAAAACDIGEIERHSTVEFGSSQTVEYLGGLRETLARLRDYPGIGLARDDLRNGTRSMRFGSHRIYYRQIPGGVLVQRVLHYARQVRREMIDDS